MGTQNFRKGGGALWKLLNLTLPTERERGSETVTLAKGEEMKERFKMDKEDGIGKG